MKAFPFFFSFLVFGGSFAWGSEEVLREWKFMRGDRTGTEGRLNITNIEQTLHAWVSGKSSQTLGTGLAYTEAAFDDSSWRHLTIPHDWGVDKPFDYAAEPWQAYLDPLGVGWYRREIKIAKEDAGKNVSLHFDGAMSYAVVWVNGRFAGGWPYGYTQFHVDITPFLVPGGLNVVAVRCENVPEMSRWYTGGGLYRKVRLIKKNKAHFKDRGISITTPKAEASGAIVRVTWKSENAPEGANVEFAVAPGRKLTDAKKGSLEIVVERPRLWSVEKPEMYTAVVRLLDSKGMELDREDVPFGIRKIGFYPDKRGFQLNGKRVQIKGVCLHHDLGVLGAAFNTQATERRLRLMKEAGCNAIRMSHNEPAPEFLDLCDKMGFLVMDEIFDQWRRPKHTNDYSILFDRWHERDLRSWIHSDWNHPSVIIWGIGNEVEDQRDQEKYVELGKKLVAIVHSEDTTRPTSAANNYLISGFAGFADVCDIFGYNYRSDSYKAFHTVHPSTPLFGSETICTGSSRGVYFYPVTQNWWDGIRDFLCSSYDWMANDYYSGNRGWACPPDDEWRMEAFNPCVMGNFTWAGIDYLGAPGAIREYVKRSKVKGALHTCTCGMLDLACLKKDRFYLYQSAWRPELQMCHILPHWNWPDRVGQVTPVYVYTSGDGAELFLNGKSLGRKTKGRYEYRLMWNEVRYEPGELRAIAYKGEKAWAEARVSTTGPAAGIALEPEPASAFGAVSGEDNLSFVTVKVLDAKGLFVATAQNRVKVSLQGPGEIVATDSGCERDFDSFKSPERNVFNGLLSVIVRRKGPGAIALKAESEGLQAGACELLK